jgi:hypothetical protein
MPFRKARLHRVEAEVDADLRGKEDPGSREGSARGLGVFSVAILQILISETAIGS